MQEDEARRRFEASSVAHLATANFDGTPHVVPCVFIAVAGVVYTAVDDKPKRSRRLRRLDNIRTNPRVALVAGVYDEDWSRLWWARADGSARVLQDGPEFDQAVAGLRAKYPQYRGRSIPGPVVAIDVDRWSGWP